MTEDEIKALPTLITADQARKILQLGKNAIYELIQQNKIPVLRLGERKIRIPKHEFLNWIQNQLS
jgi:excisionase family DNA binding protein